MGTRQADRKFGELAEPAVDLDRAAVLLGDDVIGDRQAEAGAFAGRLCCNKGLKQLFWTSGAIPVPLSRPGLWQNGSTSLRPKLNTRALSFVRSRCRMPV